MLSCHHSSQGTETKLIWCKLECQDCLHIFYKPIVKGNMSNQTKKSTDIGQGVKPVLTDDKTLTCSFSQDFATSQKNYSSSENSTVKNSSQGMGL